ncbi:hypothetical protein CVT25_004374 [Psilocybe cyanescens]|uniref:Uncharacterized protein n=1 Tax=Psilocybe cyanescens TaxID=93625 RepID=A0A409XVW4_PSICY|nr:hypothetical protein CVT25_004374 [Psilocybe cyanescens]
MGNQAGCNGAPITSLPDLQEVDGAPKEDQICDSRTRKRAHGHRDSFHSWCSEGDEGMAPQKALEPAGGLPLDSLCNKAQRHGASPTYKDQSSADI